MWHYSVPFSRVRNSSPCFDCETTNLALQLTALNFLLHLFAVFCRMFCCNVLRLPWLKAGCNSMSLSRASLECRDPQDHLDLQDLQDPKVSMELAAHQWVLLNSYQVFCCDYCQLFSTVVSHLCIVLCYCNILIGNLLSKYDSANLFSLWIFSF